MSRGILFLAKGQGFIDDARMAAQEVKSVMPGTSVSIVTDEDVDAPCFDEVILDRTAFDLTDKPAALAKSPYEKTIYMDSDIYLKEDIDEVFDVLNSFDLALVRDHVEYNIRKRSDPHPIDGVPEGVPEFNSGFIAYRDSPKVMELFRDWENRIQPAHSYDQRALRPSLYDSSLRFICLPPRYNCLYQLHGHVTGTVKVFHAASGDLEKEVDVEDAVRKFEQSAMPRAFQTYEETVFVGLSPPLHRKVLTSLRKRGIVSTGQKAINKLLNIL